ncbi:LysR family transcriptional regulator [Oceanobacillus polygoni]|uniref:DNA-binding transcriptional LysR family regulator n=1 Tax=Oceanobacillus polygoni TaxID=1235259 RepID=A0A9X0YU39_9BACI|nr:LysR family transcriptional regulator [Oceanobacillus polygoni]MBP2077056.1 DNA-binding transcriptional LysR family regulator [Oceanobacillus polygoni]
MSIQRFEILNKVVQLQNITKAATELNLSQSGISYAIKNLEEELDVQLLIRNRSGVTLTSEGERIYQHSLSVTKAYENLIQEAAAIKGIERGTIHIGTFASVTTNWIPKIITVFKERFPGITIKIYEDDYQSLENAVIAGELDCCFSTISNNKQLAYIPLKKDKLYCIVSNDCPLSKQKVMKISQIGDYPLIKPKADWDNEISDFFSSHKINPAIAYEVSDDQSIIALVQANLGINIRPGLVLTNRTPNITVLDLEDDAYRMIGLATCNHVSHATQRFISVVTELFQEM